MTRVIRQICLPVSTAGRPAGMIQHGTVGSYPIHAAACRCGAAVYDQSTFEDAAQWIRRHLSAVHGVDVVEVDVRRLVRRQSASWQRRASEVVSQVAACWGEAGVTPLVATTEINRTSLRGLREVEQILVAETADELFAEVGA
jgi:hypothetical protein